MALGSAPEAHSAQAGNSQHIEAATATLNPSFISEQGSIRAARPGTLVGRIIRAFEQGLVRSEIGHGHGPVIKTFQSTTVLVFARVVRALILLACFGWGLQISYSHFKDELIKVPMVTVFKQELEVPSMAICPGSQIHDIVEENMVDYNVSLSNYANTDDVTTIVEKTASYRWDTLHPRFYWKDSFAIYQTGCWILDFSSLATPYQMKATPSDTDVLRLEFKLNLKPGNNLSSVPKKRRSIHIGLYDSLDSERKPNDWEHTILGKSLMGRVEREDFVTINDPLNSTEQHFWRQHYLGKFMNEEGSELRFNILMNFPDDSFFVRRSVSYYSPLSPSALLVLAVLLGGVANLANLFNLCFPLDGPRRIGMPMHILTCCMLVDQSEEDEEVAMQQNAAKRPGIVARAITGLSRVVGGESTESQPSHTAQGYGSLDGKSASEARADPNPVIAV